MDNPQDGQPVDAASAQISQPPEALSSITHQPDTHGAESSHESSAASTSVESPEPVSPPVEEKVQAGSGKLGRLELPEVWPTADLSQPATKKRPLAISMALCFTITFLVYIAFIPRFTLFSNPPTGDQPFYLM